METPTRSRWFPFVLRGLLVFVTLFGGLLGWLLWQRQIVLGRTAFPDRMLEPDRGGFTTLIDCEKSGYDYVAIYGYSKPVRPVPIWRRAMGDETVIAIALENRD